MKTSNKILLALIAVVFTVPLLLAFALQGKIKKGEYTVEKYKNYGSEYERTGTFAAYNVVKIVAPRPENLQVRLEPSDEMKYTYYNRGSKDTVTFSNINDTLVVEYKALVEVKTEEDMDMQENMYVYVKLPRFNNLVIDGAAVVIDSLPPSAENMTLVLKNRGELRDGSKPKAAKVGTISKTTSPKAEHTASIDGKEERGLLPFNLNLKKMINVKAATAIQTTVKEQILDELVRVI